MTRIVAIENGDKATAYSFEDLGGQHVINDTVDNLPVVLFWQKGAASALDRRRIADGQDIGMVTTFDRRLENRVFEFSRRGNRFNDNEMGSTWNLHGEAIEGELKGQRLEPVVHINHFWFSYFAFRPDARVDGWTGGRKMKGSVPSGTDPPPFFNCRSESIGHDDSIATAVLGFVQCHIRSIDQAV